MTTEEIRTGNNFINRKGTGGEHDFFETPAWVTEALLKVEGFSSGLIWEPAAGNGAISKVVNKYGYKIFSSDAVQREYDLVKIDFLKCFITFEEGTNVYVTPLFSLGFRPDHIITNPPYNKSLEFVLKALEIARRKVAMLLRIDFLGSKKRYEGLFKDHPPARIHVFFRRISFGRTAKVDMLYHAWFVWEKGWNRKTEIDWIYEEGEK
jgi:hypothetical protein